MDNGADGTRTGEVGGTVPDNGPVAGGQDGRSTPAAMPAGGGRPDHPLTRHRGLALSFMAIALAMVPWIVYLGLSLPPRYDAGHWNLLWIGFDVALVSVLSYTGWAAWFRRQIMASTSLVAATLLLCDAWFDMVSSIGHPDEWLTLLTGFGAEIPLAVFFIWLYRHIVMSTLAAYHQLAHDESPPTRFRDARIVLSGAHALNRRDGSPGPSRRSTTTRSA